jgi:hypothetical protein
MVPGGSEVVVIVAFPGVGPLSPPQPVNPRIVLAERMTIKRIILPMSLRFIVIVSHYVLNTWSPPHSIIGGERSATFYAFANHA